MALRRSPIVQEVKVCSLPRGRSSPYRHNTCSPWPLTPEVCIFTIKMCIHAFRMLSNFVCVKKNYTQRNKWKKRLYIKLTNCLFLFIWQIRIIKTDIEIPTFRTLFCSLCISRVQSSKHKNMVRRCHLRERSHGSKMLIFHDVNSTLNEVISSEITQTDTDRNKGNQDKNRVLAAAILFLIFLDRAWGHCYLLSLHISGFPRCLPLCLRT